MSGYGTAPSLSVGAIEQAIRDGRAFVASTGMQAVASGNFLNVTFANPAGSGKRVIVFKRRFDSNIAGNGSPLEYGGITTPVALAAPTAAPGRNLITGNANSGVVAVNWNMAAARVDSSPSTTAPIGGAVPVGGVPLKLVEWRIIPPGQSFANFIGGAGGGLAATARCGFTIYWLEEPLT